LSATSNITTVEETEWP